MLTLMKTEVTILIIDQVDFRAKNITRDTEGHLIMKRELINQEDMTS